MIEPLHLGLQGLASAQGETAGAALARLTAALMAAWSPFRAELPRALGEVDPGIPADLPVEERWPLLGRALARALEQACLPALESLVGVAATQLAAEATRWERLAETVDLIGPPTAGTPLLARVRAANARYAQLGASAANAGVAARHHAAVQAFADALGLPLASALLRTARGGDLDALRAQALAALLEGEAARAAFDRLGVGLLAPLLDVIDHHLRSLSGP